MSVRFVSAKVIKGLVTIISMVDLGGYRGAIASLLATSCRKTKDSIINAIKHINPCIIIFTLYKI